MMESLHAVSSECIFIIHISMHLLLKQSVTAHSAEDQTGLILVIDCLACHTGVGALSYRNR